MIFGIHSINLSAFFRYQCQRSVFESFRATYNDQPGFFVLSALINLISASIGRAIFKCRECVSFFLPQIPALHFLNEWKWIGKWCTLHKLLIAHTLSSFIRLYQIDQMRTKQENKVSVSRFGHKLSHQHGQISEFIDFCCCIPVQSPVKYTQWHLPHASHAVWHVTNSNSTVQQMSVEYFHTQYKYSKSYIMEYIYKIYLVSCDHCA